MKPTTAQLSTTRQASTGIIAGDTALPCAQLPSSVVQRGPEVPGGSTRYGGGPAAGDLIDLRFLVIAGDDQAPGVAAITATLDRLGARYNTLIARRERLAEQRLWSGNHAFYQAIILATGNLGYQDPVTQQWESAFDAEQWHILWCYEARFGIRQVTWYTFPGGYPDDYGLRLAGTCDTVAAPLAAKLTGEGQRIFWYLNGENPVTVRYAWTYLTTPLDSATTPLLVTSEGYVIAAIRRYADGRENLALTTDSAPDLMHTLLLGYGLVNWVGRGLFLGERHVYLSPQVDDIFFRTRLWEPAPSAAGEPIYRIDAPDVRALLNWLDRLHRHVPNAGAIELELAFNGEGTLAPAPDDALVPILAAHQARFRWVNHTFRHPLMHEVDYQTSVAEIRRNHQVAAELGLQRYHPDSLVTPEFSGLDHADFMRAACDSGIRFLIADTSRLKGSLPPNTGIVSQLQPELLIIPRHPNNVFFNVSTPAELVSEYNQIYYNFWHYNLTFEEIIDREADMMLPYLLKFDINPVMFHQANLRAYDGAHSLTTLLIDRLLRKYNACYAHVPICSLSMHEIGQAMLDRARYREAAIEATLVRGRHLTVRADRAVVVPITGVRVGPDAELYGDQAISSVAVSLDHVQQIPLEALVGYQSTAVDSGAPFLGGAHE
jgi:hypothetical protein